MQLITELPSIYKVTNKKKKISLTKIQHSIQQSYFRYSLSKAPTIKSVILTGKEAKALDQTESKTNNQTNNKTKHDQTQNINKNYQKFLAVRQTSCHLKISNHRCTSMCTYRSIFSQKEQAEMRLLRLKPFRYIPTIWGSIPNSSRELGRLLYGRKKTS